jgi:hypothetical protein
MQEEEKEKALAKVKKYQRELEETEERADAAQIEADKLKSRMRTAPAARLSVSGGDDDAVCLAHRYLD